METKKSAKFISIVLLLFCFVSLTQAAIITKNMVADFGMQASNAKPAVDSALVWAKSYMLANPNDDVVLYFPAGTWNFVNPGTAAIYMNNWGIIGKLTFRGESSATTVLSFTEYDQRCFYIGYMDKFTMENMHLTRPQLLTTQGEVVSSANGTVRVQIHPGFPDPVWMFDNGNPAERVLSPFKYKDGNLLDPVTSEVCNRVRIAAVTSAGGDLYDFVAESLDVWKANLLIPGTLVALKSQSSNNMLYALASKYMTFQDVRITKGGMWLTLCDDVTVRRVVVDRSGPVNGRLPFFGTTADGIHIWPSQGGGNILVEDCTVEGTADDGIAVINTDATYLGLYATNIIIRNNTVKMGLARSIILNWADGAQIYGNTLTSVSDGAIMMGGVKNTLVTNNTISGNVHGEMVYISPANDPAGNTGNRIVSNTFEQVCEDLHVIVLEDSTDTEVSGNLVTSWSDVDGYTPANMVNPAPVTYAVNCTNVYGINELASGTLMPLVVSSGSSGITVTWGGAPTGLVATAGNGSVSLDWADNPEPGLMHYNIYRSTTSGSGYALIHSGQLTSDYVDNSIVNNTTYYYVVTAVVSSNESGYSNEASATPQGTGVEVTIVGHTAGAQNPGAEAYKSYDNNETTRWTNDGTLPNAWIQYDLGSSKSVIRVRLKTYNGSTRTYPIKIEVDSTEVFNGNTTLTSGYWETSFASTTGRYVKITMTGLNSSGSYYLSFWEAEVYEYGGAPDTTPPTPNPATFASAPAAISDTAITMTATTGSDPSGPVQYLFTETSGNPGGTSSAWQTSPTYTDTGLTASTQYTYTVTMRDSLANTGTASSPASATTQAPPDTTPPTPNPATFASAPAATSDTAITMTATTGSDPSGPVEYYFDETSGNPGGTDSGWQTSPSYTDSGLNPSTLYTYTVQMRDSASTPNVGTASSPASATTQSAIPTFVAAGTVKSGIGDITPALPSGIATNDILLLFVETSNQAVSVSNQNGGTWAEVTGSPQGTGGTRLTVFWSRYNGTQGNPTVSDSGDHQIARMIAVRGAVSSGNPWNVTAGGVEATSDTSGSIPGATTTVANTLVVVAVAGDLPDSNGTANFSGWTNANLTDLTERTDNTANSGNGGALGIATGIKATAGAYGNTSVTHASAAVKGMISIAIRN